MPAWSLHPQLAADCHAITRLIPSELPSCQVLLHKNAIVPWVLLVPEIAPCDWDQLSPDLATWLSTTAQTVGQALRAEYDHVSRINIGALGLVVPQFHFHIIGRYPDDPCWPQPVWGNLKNSQSYAANDLASIRDALIARLGSGS